MARQQLPGGPARARVEEALAIHEAALAADLTWYGDTNARIAAAAAALEGAVDDLLAG